MWAVEKIILQIPKRSFILFQADVPEVEAASYCHFDEVSTPILTIDLQETNIQKKIRR